MKAVRFIACILLLALVFVFSSCATPPVEELRISPRGSQFAVIDGYTGSLENVYIPDYHEGLKVENISGDLVDGDFTRRIARFEGENLKRVYFPWSCFSCSSAGYESKCIFSDGVTVFFAHCNDVIPQWDVKQVIPRPTYEKYLLNGKIGKYTINAIDGKLLAPANVSYLFNYDDAPNENYFFIDLFDSTGKLVEPPYSPTREGYHFRGWYKDPDCTTPWDFDTDVVTINKDANGKSIYEETALYAKWEVDPNAPLLQYLIMDHRLTITDVNLDLLTKDLVIPDKIDGIKVEVIADNVFSGLDIETLTLPKSVITIGEGAFKDCDKLTSVTFNGGGGLKTIGKYAFANCTSLVDFKMPEYCNHVLDYAFMNTAIKTVYIGMGLEQFSSTAFLGAPVESYYQAKAGDTYEVVDGALYDHTQKRLVAYPCRSAATEFALPSGINSIATYAFAGAINLESVNLGNVIDISNGAFMGCERLASITAPETIRVGEKALDGTMLIDIENGKLVIGKVLVRYITDSESASIEGYYRISSGAFDGCNNLKNVFIKSVYYIDELAFANCGELRTVWLAFPLLVDIEVGAFNKESLDKIYVPSHRLEDYRTSNEEYKDYFGTHETTVIFDSNGGTPVDSCTVGFLIEQRLPVPSLPGSKFLGWSYTKDGEVITIDQTEWVYPWYITDDEITLVATWQTL